MLLWRNRYTRAAKDRMPERREGSNPSGSTYLHLAEQEDAAGSNPAEETHGSSNLPVETIGG